MNAVFPASPSFFIVSMAALAVVPFFLIGATSFLKISIVFGILKNALGAQQVPSAMVTSLLAIVLSLHIMRPVASETVSLVAAKARGMPSVERWGFAQLIEVGESAKGPLITFLARQSGEKERLYFLFGPEQTAAADACRAQNASGKGICEGEGLFSLLPAFVISQLREGFAFGFMLFLPFLVIDLVIAHVLLGMGLTMVSPVTITLPLKILLFVSADSWMKISALLIESYR